MDIWENVWKDGEIDGCIHLSELLFGSKADKRAINSINGAGTATTTIRRENRRWTREIHALVLFPFCSLIARVVTSDVMGGSVV